MNRTITAAVHNKFEVVVTDATTGEVKQTAIGYNVILNRFFTQLVNRSSKLGYIHLGSGTGTPAITDSSLFTFKTAKQATTVETVKAYPTSYVRKSITLSPSESAGVTFTEVGFGYSTSNTSLVTHSMLQDSEGNQIAIYKSATDVLTVYATFYCTIATDTSAECVLPTLANNALIPAIISDTYASMYLHFSGEAPMSHSNDITKSAITSVSVSSTADTANYQWILKAYRLDYTAGNSHMFSAVGIPNIAAWALPNSTVFPNVKLTDIPVGTGDGTKTEFDCPIPLFIENSEVVRVNGVTMERGVDYTINHRQPNKDYLELLPCCNPSNVTVTGGIQSTGNGMMLWYDSARPNQVSPTHPMIFDFGSVQTFNRITAPANWLYADTWQAYGAIDYSIDGESWTTAYSGYNRSETGRIAIDITLSPAVQARYWRLRVTNVSWNYDTTHRANLWPNLCIWKEEPGLVFTTPPEDGAAIELDCTIDRPIKNENWVLDFSCAVQFARG